jgi:hypothetical protein
LGGKTVKFSVFQFNDSAMNNPVTTATAVVDGTSLIASTTVSLPADNYTIKLELVDNNQYAAPIENAVVTVVNPDTGMTTGGGWFIDPVTNARTNVSFTVKYNRGNSGNAQGNNLLISHEQRDLSAFGAPAGLREYNIIYKSNVMSALQTSAATSPKTAMFTGKNNIRAVDRLTGMTYDITGGINYQFQVDVTDRSESGSSSEGFDSYAFRVWSVSGNYKVIGTYGSNGTNTSQVSLTGGNLQVK